MFDKNKFKKISLFLFFIMFIYSGISKIFNFSKKVNTLQNKTGLPHQINVLGMIGVIILEIIGSLMLLFNEIYPGIIPQYVNKLIYLSYILFMIVVTLLYHPPGKAMVPFLSNLTTFGAFIYIYSDKFIK
jgi:uncharacterized membrane protein YphA (DoxX/SURF4 family)